MKTAKWVKIIRAHSMGFDANALNALFRTLHTNTVLTDRVLEYVLEIYDNPGERNCDRSIATSKGWTVYGW